MRFTSANDASPGTMISLLLARAIDSVFPDRKELRGRTGQIRLGLRRAAEEQLTAAWTKVRQWNIRLAAASPERRVGKLLSGSALEREKLNHAVRIRLDGAAAKLMNAGKELAGTAQRRTESAQMRILRVRERLEAINPMGVLERGYSLVTDRTGNILTGSQQARDAEDITVRFADGAVEAAVKKDGVRNN